MDWESFLPPFFGVLAAFVLQWLAKQYERGRNRRKFLQDIRHELEVGASYLTGAARTMPSACYKDWTKPFFY